MVFAADDRVKTWYDAMQLQIQRPIGSQSRWGGGIAYTLARMEEQGQSTDMFWGWNDKYPTVADRPRLRSPGDQRHTVAANFIARLPWEIMASGIVQLGSGIALNGTDASGGWGPYQQRTYLFTPPTRSFLGVGNVFATQNADLRLEKGLTVGLGNTATVVLDLYNAFNSQNLGCYDWNNTIVPTADQNADWRSRYGTAGCAALGRRMQVGLRYGYRGAQQGERSPGGGQ